MAGAGNPDHIRKAKITGGTRKGTPRKKETRTMENRGSLEQRALLVNFQTSCWPGTAPDKTADKDIQAARGNKAGTTKTTKWLVNEVEIKKVHKAFKAAYAAFIELTTPWEIKRGGARAG